MSFRCMRWSLGLSAVFWGGLVLLVAGCAPSDLSRAVPTAVLALEDAYTVAAQSEVAVAPSLSDDEVGVMTHLDAQAYAALVPLRAAAETGSATATETQAATTAIGALNTFLASHKGV